MSYPARLTTIVLTIFLSGVVVFALGYSLSAVVLAVVLVTALSVAPTLIAVEGLLEQRRERRHVSLAGQIPTDETHELGQCKDDACPYTGWHTR